MKGETALCSNLNMKSEKIKGNFIKLKRLEKGLSINEVAKKVGLSGATIYAIEAGDRKLVSKVVDNMMNVLDIDPMYRKFLIYPEDILKREVLSRGEYLKLLRLESGLTIPELSKQIGVSVSTLSCIEISTRNITNEVYKELASVLGISDIKYTDLNVSKLFVLYAIDPKYRIPIIEGTYLSRQSVSLAKQSAKENCENLLWRIKEYDFETKIKAREKSVGKKNVG